MFKIAWKGLTGRKKDSFMLLSILFLSFFFSILTSTFQTNSEGAKSLERRTIYGSWQYGAYGIKEGTDPFTGLSSIEVTGKNRIIGRSTGFGTLASFDEGFIQQAELSFLDGRLPQGIDEVAVEENQLSFFNEIPKVGSRFIADTEVHIFDLEMENEPEETRIMMGKLATETILDNLTPLQRQFFEELYGIDGDVRELKERLRQDLEWALYVFVENRQRSQGLENFEDTILLQVSENLLFGYSLDFSELIRNPLSTLTEAEKTRGLQTINGLLKEIEGRETGPYGGSTLTTAADDLVIRGEGLVLPYKRSYVVRRTLTVTGIYQSISTAWPDGAGNVPTALVTKGTAEKFIENGLLQSDLVKEKGYDIPVNHFIRMSTEEPVSNSEVRSGQGIIANDLAYPPGGSVDGILALAILIFIFIITLFGVFQLYTSQMNHRLRKLALLRAVGATTRQIRRLLLYELLILIGITLPLALAAGIGLARLLSQGLQSELTNFVFQVNGRILALSILAGLFAVALGVLQPLTRVQDIPLTGSIPLKKPKNPTSARKILGGKTGRVRNLRSVLALHQRFNRKQSFLTRLTYTLIFSAMILSMLLSFLSFRDYRDQVVAVNMPDFEITLDYALNREELKNFEKDLRATGAVAELQHLIGRRKGQLTSGDIWHDPLYDDAWASLPKVLKEELFVTQANTQQYPSYFTEDARKVNVYGLDTGSLLFQILNSSSGGLLDNDAFKTGTGVVLLYPQWLKERDGESYDPDSLVGIAQTQLLSTIFHNQGSLRLSYDFRNQSFLESLRLEDTPVQIELTFNSEVNQESQKNVLPPTVYQVEILDVITVFPEFGIWPFSHTLEHPVILGSQNMVRQLLMPTRSIELLKGTPPRLTLTPTVYGTQATSVWATATKDSDQFILVQQVANRYGGRAQNLHTDKEARFNAALRISAIVLVVAFIIALTALQIQMNISKARVEGERLFIGTLQSMGVSQKKLRRAYRKTGLGYSLMAVLASHTTFVLILVFQLMMDYPPDLVTTSPLTLLKSQLWLYPWLDHFILTLAFLVIGTLIYYLPLRKVLKIDPITNIRGL